MTVCADPNTGLKMQVSSKAPNAVFAITITGTGNTRTITIETEVEARHLFRLWLVDDDTDPGELSQTLPDDPQDNEWWEVTNASGVLTKDITFAGTHTWYVAATLIGPVGVSDALEFT